MPRNAGEVLPFTLSELFVLLFFALALALVWQSNARAEAEDEAMLLRDTLAEAEETLGPTGVSELVRMLRESRDSIPDDFKELVRSVRDQAQVREALQAHLRERGLDSAAVNAAPTQMLVDSLLAMHSEAERRAETMAVALQRSGKDGNALMACTDTLAAARTDLATAFSDLANARNQAQACFRRLGNGLDHPPCWADDAGRPEYAFNVTLHTSTVTVTPAWAAGRADDAERIPGMRAAVGDRMSYGEFSRRALPVFEWSTQQNPECRHFVRIVDRVDGGKDAFKKNLLTVERFFYKLLAN